MNLFSILSAIAAVLNVAVGGHVLFINPKATLNRLYVLYALMMAVWNFGDLLFGLSPTVDQALRMDTISTIGSATSVAFFLHFFWSFPRGDLSLINR